MTISGARFGVVASFTDRKVVGGQAADFPANLESISYLNDGSGDGQISKGYYNRLTLTNTATDLDLAAGVQDFYGATLTFATVKSITVVNREASGSGKNVTIGGAPSNAFQGPFGATNDVVTIPPGGRFHVDAPNTGWTVTATTGDLLRLLGVASGTSVDVIITGT